MGRKCSVLNCTRRRSRGDAVTLFSVPKTPKEREKWQETLGCRLFKNSFVCDNHFLPRDIKSSEIISDQDGKILYEYHFIKKTLVKGAEPCRNTMYDADNEMEILPVRCDQSNNYTSEKSISDSDNNNIESQIIKKKNNDLNCAPVNEKPKLNLQIHSPTIFIPKLNPISDEKLTAITTNLITAKDVVIRSGPTLFELIVDNRYVIKTPKPSWGFHYSAEKKQLIFSYMELLSCSEENEIIPTYTKQILVNERSEFKLFFYGKSMEMKSIKIPTTLREFENLIVEVDRIKICIVRPIS